MATNHSFVRGVVLRLLLVILLTGLLTICLVYHQLLLLIICSLGLLLVCFRLLHYLNNTNRKLTLFFEAIRNDDTSVVFNENHVSPDLKKLYQNLNRINKHIADIKRRSEENELFLTEMIRKSGTGLLAVDEKGYVVQVNDAALQVIGMPYLANIQLLRQKNPVFWEAMNQLPSGSSQTIKLIGKNSVRHISIKASRLEFGNRHYRIFSLNDIRKEIEENELDSWQKLISVLTHEIMNSIAPVTSFSNTLKRFLTREGKPITPDAITSNDIEQTLTGLEVIEERGRGLLDFVENYRKFIRIPKPTFNNINISKWLNRIELLMTPDLKGKNIQLSIQRREQLEYFTGDEKLLAQVILNLLNNAVDALDSRNSPAIMLITKLNDRGSLSITIKDNGGGIHPDNLESIFVPFFTTKENGSGIGLSLARRIMILHGGSINVQSAPDHGTTFTLVF